MIKIGVTGGIGSGKSVVCQVFSILGIPVYYADEEAKKLTDTDAEIRDKLISVAGKKVYTQKGLNRPLLADLIFNSSGLLQKVNSIIHPRVAAHFEAWCQQQKSTLYIIHESALIFESGLSIMFNKIVAVTAPIEIRIKRVLPRKTMNAGKIESIMKNQFPSDEIIKRADYLIVNDDATLLIPQILKLHEIFLHLK